MNTYDTPLPASTFAAALAAILDGPAPHAWPCDWDVYRGLTEDGEEWYERCGAVATADRGGWTCAAGHDHRTYGGPEHTEYVDADDLGAWSDAGVLPPTNARRI